MIRTAGFLALLTTLAALTGCGGGTKLTLLCKNNQVYTKLPNRVSFVFKAEQDDGLNTPITDLDTLSASSFKVSDGGFSSGGESVALSIARPQNVRLRTLIVLDGSGSLADSEQKNEGLMKSAVTNFVNSVDLTNNVVGVYMFHGTPGVNTVLEEIHAFDSARNTKDAILADLEKTTIIREYASTALHDAISAGVGLLSRQSDPSAVVMIKSMILFTDGKDEVYSGSEFTASQTRAVNDAAAFKQTDSNSIFVAAMKPATGGSFDDELLSKIASNSGSKSVISNLSSLSTTFTKFAADAEKQAKKYYQLNMCSNRRAQSVDANLELDSQKYKTTSAMPFSYNASQFTDPAPGGCAVESLREQTETCEWSTSSSDSSITTGPTPAPTAAGVLAAYSWGSVGADEGEPVSITDADGNYIVAAQTGVAINSQVGVPSSNFSVAKFSVGTNNTLGALVWTANMNQGAPFGYVWGVSVATDPNTRDVYVAGYFTGNLQLPTTTAGTRNLSATDNDIFVWKISASGTSTWAKQFNASNLMSTGPGTLAIAYSNSTSSLLLAGALSGTIDFGTGATLTNTSNANHIFMVNMNATTAAVGMPFSYRVGTKTGGTPSDISRILINSQGRVFVLARATQSGTVGANSQAISSVSRASTTYYVTRAAMGNETEWVYIPAATATTQNTTPLNMVFGNTQSDLVIAYSSGGNLGVARITDAGLPSFTKVSTIAANDLSAAGMAVDTGRNIYVTGSSGYTVGINPSTSLPMITSSRIALHKFSGTNGDVLWSKAIGDGTSKAYGTSIGVTNGTAPVLVGGLFWGALKYGSSGAQTINSDPAESADLFMLKVAQ